MVGSSVFLLLTGLAHQATAVGCMLLQHIAAALDSEAVRVYGLHGSVAKSCCLCFGQQHLVYSRVPPRVFHVPLHG